MEFEVAPDKVNKTLYRPFPWVHKVGFDGKTVVNFDQFMRKPANLTEVETGTTLINGTRLPHMEVQVYPKYGEWAGRREKDLKFTWNFTDFYESQFVIQLWFEKPEYVASEIDPDELKITFWGHEHFVDLRGVSVEPEISINHDMIPQLSPPVIPTIRRVAVTLSTSIVSTIIVSVIMKFALQGGAQ